MTNATNQNPEQRARDQLVGQDDLDSVTRDQIGKQLPQPISRLQQYRLAEKEKTKEIRNAP